MLPIPVDIKILEVENEGKKNDFRLVSPFRGLLEPTREAVDIYKFVNLTSFFSIFFSFNVHPYWVNIYKALIVIENSSTLFRVLKNILSRTYTTASFPARLKPLNNNNKLVIL